MYQSNQTVQRMIEWLEQNLLEDPGLLPLTKYVGYSPWYCSALFHQVSGMTLRSYVAKGGWPWRRRPFATGTAAYWT